MNNKGTAAIEFAIVLPVLFAFALGLVDLGRAMWVQTSLDYAAQTAARCAAIGTSCATQTVGVGDATVSVVDAKIVTDANGKVSCNTSGSGNPAKQATAAVGFVYFLPVLSHFSGTLSAKACYPT